MPAPKPPRLTTVDEVHGIVFQVAAQAEDLSKAHESLERVVGKLIEEQHQDPWYKRHALKVIAALIPLVAAGAAGFVTWTRDQAIAQANLAHYQATTTQRVEMLEKQTAELDKQLTLMSKQQDAVNRYQLLANQRHEIMLDQILDRLGTKAPPKTMDLKLAEKAARDAAAPEEE